MATSSSKAPVRRVEYLGAAVADLERLKGDDVALYQRARGLLDLVEANEYDGVPLKEMSKYGDLSNCRKIYFGHGPARNSHRIVYQMAEPEEGGDLRVEVIEVVAVEARDDGYVYLKAAERLGLLPAETRPTLKRAQQRRIDDRAARKKKPK